MYKLEKCIKILHAILIYTHLIYSNEYSASNDNIRMWNLMENETVLDKEHILSNKLGVPQVSFIIIPGHHGGMISEICKKIFFFLFNTYNFIYYEIYIYSFHILFNSIFI